MKKLTLFILIVLSFGCSTEAPEAYGPVPTKEQLAWQKMEMNMFCHFGPNTFSGKEWGEGTEPEDIFNPSSLDCRQWVAVAKSGGFKGIIITAKHHDGFCLWPNPESEHTVAKSSWRGGKGDVLRDLSDACAEGGVRFGVYISPWDRHDPNYGTPEYNNVYVRTLEDVYSKYDNIFEHWFDGANGEGPDGKKQVYDWPAFYAVIRKMQPDAVMFGDIGPDCRWGGNEKGIAGSTNWSRLDTEGFGAGEDAPCPDTLNTGNKYGAFWIPVEMDVSLRKGWFHHADDAPKSIHRLLDIYYKSVGRNAVLLLNVPPDERGLICKEDSLRIDEFRTALDSIFKTNLAKDAIMVADKCRGRRFDAKNIIDGNYDSYWTTKDNDRSAVLTLSFAEKKRFNRILIQEYIPLGQRIDSFHIEALGSEGNWKTIASETTIGYKRIILTDTIETDSIRLVIDSSLACPIINNIEVYYDDIFDSLMKE